MAATPNPDAARWRMSLGLSSLVFLLYFGFILLVAYQKALMGTQIIPGLSVGIVLGAAVIISSWALTGIYVAWTNAHVRKG